MAWEYKGILGPVLRWANKKGETAFEMKRKDGHGPTYYLFRICEENFTEKQRMLWPAVWGLMRLKAAQMSLPLYDYREVTDAIEHHLDLITGTPEGRRAQRQANETSKTVFVKDVRIKVFDHATGGLNDLTVGISIDPAGKHPEKT